MTIGGAAAPGVRYQRLSGPGDPTVLVHGSWSDHHLWDRVGPSLSSALDIVVYDRRGYGPPGPAATSPPQGSDAADLAALLEGLDLYPVHLVAHGFAAALALRLALDRPELARSIAVLDPGLPATADRGVLSAAVDEETRTHLRGLVERARRGASSEVAREYHERYGGGAEEWESLPASVRSAMGEYASLWAAEVVDPLAGGPSDDELRSLDLPVLVTLGRSRPAVIRRLSERLVSALPNARLQLLAEGGSYPELLEPDLVVGILGTFLIERNVPST